MGAAKKRLMPLLGASVLLTGGIGACVLLIGGHGTSVRLTADTANAAVCPPATPCDVPGTAILGGGTLALTAPPALTWGGTITWC